MSMASTFPPRHAVAPARKVLSVGACILWHLAVVLAVTALYFVAEPSTTLIVGGVLSFVVFVMLAVAESRRDAVWFTPLSYFFYWFSVAFGPAAIFIGTRIAGGNYFGFAVAWLPPGDVAAGYVIMMAGQFAFHVGLQTLRPKLNGKQKPVVPSGRFDMAATVGVWFLGLLMLRGLLPVSGAVSALLEFSAFSAMLYVAASEPGRFGLTSGLHGAVVTVGTIIGFVAALHVPTKMYLMWALLPLFIYVIARPKLRKLLPAAALAGIFLYLTVLAPAVNESRLLIVRAGESRTDRFLQAFQMYSPLYTGEINMEFYYDQLQSFALRMAEFTPVGFIHGEVRKYGYLYGETMDNLAYAFVPRVLWPEKPIVTKGAWFTTRVGVAPRETEATTSTGMSAPGEAYWNFGIWGMLPLMFLLGLGYSLLWRMAGNSPSSGLLNSLLYVNTTFSMVNSSEYSSLLVSIVINFVIFGLLMFFVSGRWILSRTPHVIPQPLRTPKVAGSTRA